MLKSRLKQCCHQKKKRVTKQWSPESSDSTSESDSSESVVPKDHSFNRVFAPPRPPTGYDRWQHSKLKTVHLTAPGYCKVFVCGRPVGSFHCRVDEDPRFDSPICWACFNKASVE